MDPMIRDFLILTGVFHIKHFFCDFPLQFPYMITGKAQRGWNFFLPLASHALTHCCFTIVICFFYRPQLWWLGILDFAIHFVIDRIKSGPKYLGKYDDQGSMLYWAILGADQMVHHLTHMYIVYLLVTSTQKLHRRNFLSRTKNKRINQDLVPTTDISGSRYQPMALALDGRFHHRIKGHNQIALVPMVSAGESM